jgi:hypothetical protein
MKIDIQKAIMGHFIYTFGLPKSIEVRHLSQLPSDLAIVEFSFRNYGILATNGMSSIIQVSDNGHSARTELFLRFQSKRGWMATILESLVNYILDQRTQLAEYDTISAQSDDLGEFGLFSGLLITPPTEAEYSIGVARGIYREDIIVNSIVGISKKEIDFAILHGGVALWRRLLENNTNLLIDLSSSS